MTARERTVGIIGGSGLYDLPGLTDVEQVKLETPFGAPSDEYVVGKLGELRLCFLPRHGRGHRLLPSEVNYRANIHGMKQLGVEWLLSVSAVGSLREDIHPGDLVVIDQVIDFTKKRQSSFFGEGVAGHVTFAEPICADLGARLYEGARATGSRVRRGGTYICIEGPQFSTRAESLIWRGWGLEVIGMTVAPEAKLAREAELCYAALALATDYDCWQEGEEVSVAQVVKVLTANVEKAKATIANTAPKVTSPRTCKCKDAVQHAVMTAPAAITPEARERLQLIIGKYL